MAQRDFILRMIERFGQFLMAEFLSLDGLQSARVCKAEMARASLLKARALYDLVGPSAS